MTTRLALSQSVGRYTRWGLLLVGLGLGLGCTARGGNGGGGGGGDEDGATPADAVMGTDLGADMDGALPPVDTGTTPEDRGTSPEDTGKPPPPDVQTPPPDTGVTPVDTGIPPACGDGFCNGTETCMTCPMDCGPCPASCGDGTCQPSESCTNCPMDCGACAARCGDSACNGSETCMTCPMDCGACAPRCGDSACNGAETCSTCPMDCGECTARCGDNLCNGTETCTSCPGDCGACPTTPCTGYTTCSACAADSRCGWCGTFGTCAAGNASGPNNANDCIPVFGGWTRTCGGGGTDAGVTDAGSGSGITRSCGSLSNSDGLQAECGWRLATRYTCTPSTTITVGCTSGAIVDAGFTCGGRVGSCSGDPMIRVCAGSTECSNAGRIPALGAGSGTGFGEDDGCGLCPIARFTCPSSGSITVYERGFYRDRVASCTVGRQ